MDFNQLLGIIKAKTGHEPRKSGGGCICLCPAHQDKKPSLSVGIGDNGGIVLRCHTGCTTSQIVDSLGLKLSDLMPPNRTPPRPAAAPKKTFANADDAITALSQSHGRKPDCVWPYFNGEHVGSVLRWSNSNSTKDILPLAKQSDGRWSCAAMPEPRPLYRLPELLATPMGTPVYVVEGEKCCDALTPLGLLAVTTAGGAKAPAKTDLTPLAGRNVYVMPDADAAGRSYANYIAATARSLTPPAQVFVIELNGLGESEDVADWLPRRSQGECAADTVAAILGLAKPYPDVELPAKSAAPEVKSAAEKKQDKKAEELAALIDGIDLWHDVDGDPFATIETNGHSENWSVSSKPFSRFIKGRHYESTKCAMSDDEWQNIRSALEAQATFKGTQRSTAIRICRTDDAIFLDLADEKWQSVRVTADGWRVVSASDCPVKFLRRRGMLPLPGPKPSGSINDLRPLVNVPDSAAWILVIAWLLGALKPDQPQVALSLTGEQGSAKSTLCRMLRNTIDPNKCSARRPPKTEDDLYIAATAGLVVSLDNLSGLPAWLSDSLCSLATGGGLAKRQLFTDGDEFILDARRPILLNGIENIAERPDLMDRSISLHLPAIPDSRRSEEEIILRQFDDIHAAILGGLLGAVSTGLRNLQKVKLKTLPRMADFARWITACEPALPWKAGAFMEAYQANIAAGNSAALEGSAVASGIISLMAGCEVWEGTYRKLLDDLDSLVGDKVQKAKTWPGSPRALSGALERCRPNLRRAGIVIEDTGRDNQTRAHLLRIRRLSPDNGKDVPLVPDVPVAAEINGFGGGTSPEHLQTPKKDVPPHVPAENHQKSSLFNESGTLEHLEHLSGTSAETETQAPEPVVAASANLSDEEVF